MTGGGRVGDVVRKVVFPRLTHLRLPGTRTSAADGVAPGLRKSALVIKSRTPGQLAGTLCPNPVLRDGLHFDQVVGNRFALVTSSPLTAVQQKELKTRGAAIVSVAGDSQLGRWLKQGRGDRRHCQARWRRHAGRPEHSGDLRRGSRVLCGSRRRS